MAYATPQNQRRADDALGVGPIAAAVGVKLISGITKTPSEKRAANVLPGVVASANNGNLYAIKTLDERRGFGIAKERAVWAAGFAQLTPNVLADYNRLKAKIPPLQGQGSPEEAAQWVQNNVLTTSQLDTQGGPGMTLLGGSSGVGVAIAIGGALLLLPMLFGGRRG